MRKRTTMQRHQKQQVVSPGERYLRYYNKKVRELTIQWKCQGMSNALIFLKNEELMESAHQYARSQFSSPDEAERAFQEADSIVRRRMAS